MFHKNERMCIMYIDEIRIKLDQLKNLISNASQKAQRIREYAEENMFIPDSLCNDAITTISKITSIQNDISEALREYNEELPIGFKMIELTLSEIEKKDKIIQLLTKVKSIISSDSNYIPLLEQLISELSQNAPSPFVIEVANALLSDILKESHDSLYSISGIENSNYNQLILACMFKKLSLSEDSSPTTEKEKTIEIDKPEYPSPVETEIEVQKQPEISTDIHDTCTSTDKKPELVNSIKAAAPIEDDNSENDANNEYSEYINNCLLDFTLTKEILSKEFIIDSSPSASKQLTASNIEKLLIVDKSRGRTEIHPYFRHILIDARHFGVSAEYFSNKFICNDNQKEAFLSEISGSLEYLYQKGILLKVHLDDFPTIFIPSKNGEKIYTKDSLRKLIKYSPKGSGTPEDITCNINRFICTHILLDCYTRSISKSVPFSYDCGTGISVYGENPYVKISTSKYPIHFFYSFIPDDVNDIVNALLDVKTIFDEQNNINLVLCSTNQSFGEELCALISKESEIPRSLSLFTYNYESKKYYNYPNGEEVVLFKEITTDSKEHEENGCIATDEVEQTIEQNDIIVDTLEKNTDSIDEDISDLNKYQPDSETSAETEVNVSAVLQDKHEDIFSPKDNAVIENIDSITEKTEYSLSEEDVKNTAMDFIVNNQIYCLLAYLKAISKSSEVMYSIYQCAAYAYNDPMFNVKYNSDTIISLISSHSFLQDDFYKCLLYAATLRNFFSNDSCTDFSMKQLDQILSVETQELKNIAQFLIRYKKNNHYGVESVCPCTVREQIKYQELLKCIVSEAKEWYHTVIELPYKGDLKVKRFKDTMDSIFSKDNYIAVCLTSVINDSTKDIDFVSEFLMGFMKSDVITEENISSNNISDYVDDEWRKCCQDNVLYHSENLKSGLKSKITNKIYRTLSIISRWVHLHNSHNSETEVISEGNEKELLMLIESAINKCYDLSEKTKELVAGMNCIIFTLNELKGMVNGSYSPLLRNKYFYIDFLKSDHITLIENEKGWFIPDLTNYCNSIERFDIVSRIISHTNSNHLFPAPDDFGRKEKCNIGSLRILTNYQNDIKRERLLTENLNTQLVYDEEQDLELLKQLEHFENETIASQLRSNIKREHKKFIERIELAQSYGKFDVTDDSDIKEVIQNQTEDLYNAAIASENYGFYRFSIRCMEERIEEQAKKRIPEINGRLDALKESINNSEIDSSIYNTYIEKITQYIDVCNFTAAEDLINRIGNDDIHDNIDVYLSYAEVLSDLHNQYEKIYNLTSDAKVCLCPNDKVKDIIIRYIKNTTSAKKDENGGIQLIQKWIRGKGKGVGRIPELLSHLGINAEVKMLSVEYAQKKEVDYYDCKLRNSGENKTEYPHIVAPFGSDAYKTSFRVACFYGTFDKNRILAEIKEMSNYQKNTIIFVDYAFKENDRRELAKELRRLHYNEVYLVVDRITITYLAAHYQKSTITSQLMKLTMPFTFYQPYVPDSGNPMPPEMFVGRTFELNEIKNVKGANMLYGGRQLGKSALLKKAASDIDGNGSSVAIYVDIKENNVIEAAKAISRAFILRGIFNQNDEFEDWNDLTYYIETKMVEQKIEYLLLLIDEGDEFISDCRNSKYLAIDCLKRLATNSNIKFKYVIAGLHNLVRFDHAGARDDNVSIPHIKTMTIKPFKFSEAKQLLEYPLATLGIFFSQDTKSDGLISTILATTNYFPGLIQYYCSQVVESLCFNDCPCYDNPDAPPYYVTEAQIQKILANEEFTDKIKEKFQITLRLDTDCYYDIIALSMAWLCFENGMSSGYTTNDVYSIGESFSITKITDLSIERLSMFMDELVDLNILRKSGNEKYVFSRRNFIRLVGTYEEVFDKLTDYSSK